MKIAKIGNFDELQGPNFEDPKSFDPQNRESILQFITMQNFIALSYFVQK